VAKAKSTSARAQGKRAAVTTKKRATAHAKRNGAGNVDAVGDRLNGHAARALDGAPPTLTAQDFARIERALERCARLTEDVDSFRQIIHDCMAIEYFDTALRVAENVERWWAAILGVRNELTEFRVQFVRACEHSDSASEVIAVLHKRCARTDVDKLTDDEIERGLSIAHAKGRGAQKWSTYAEILCKAEIAREMKKSAHASRARIVEDEAHKLSVAYHDTKPARRTRKRDQRKANRETWGRANT